MKTYLVTIGYQSFVVPHARLVADILEHSTPVGSEWVNKKQVYTPEKGGELSCKVIDDSIVCTLTEEEKDNLELKKANDQATWLKQQADELRKQVEELKCQLKVALTANREEEKPQ